MLNAEKDWPKLAILYDKKDKFSPSNPEAIDKFYESAIKHRIYPTIISKNDIMMLRNFDGLFIRDTTHPAHYTYKFSLQGALYGLKVIDSYKAIRRGSNKMWQIAHFEKHGIKHPKSWLLMFNDYIGLSRKIYYPVVIKIPDMCCSKGVFLANNQSELLRICLQISKFPLIAQEFIKTDFDWRIGVFQKQILFACKYHMVPDGWTIITYDNKGNYKEGKHEAVQLHSVPLNVIATVEKCYPMLDEGLYGLDIKETPEGCYVIEINDNCNIDAEVEDSMEGDKIYDKIISFFVA